MKCFLFLQTALHKQSNKGKLKAIFVALELDMTCATLTVAPVSNPLNRKIVSCFSILFMKCHFKNSRHICVGI